MKSVKRERKISPTRKFGAAHQEEMKNLTNQLVIEKLFIQNGVFKDQHTAGSDHKVDGKDAIVIEYRGRLCPFLLNRGGCCINPFEVEGDYALLSRWSMGGFIGDAEARKMEVNLGLY